MYFFIIVLTLMLKLGNAAMNSNITNVLQRFVFSFISPEIINIDGFDLVNISSIIIGKNTTCQAVAANYSLVVDPCLQKYSRSDMCQIVKNTYPTVTVTPCTFNQKPCVNETASNACVDMTSANELCYNAICYNAGVGVCLSYFYTDVSTFASMNGLVGVACDANTVCSNSFKCIPNAPPDKCTNHIQCSVSSLSAGVYPITVYFTDGTNATSESLQSTVVALSAPVISSPSQFAYISTGTSFITTYTPSLAVVGAVFNHYLCSDTTFQNLPFILTSNSLPVLNYISSSTVPLGTAIVYPELVCSVALTYLPYNFTSLLPDLTTSNLTFNYLPLPQLYSVCPNQILSDIPYTVVVQGDDFVNTPNLKCILDNNIVTPAVFVSAKSVKCILTYVNRTSPAFVNLTLTNDGVSVALMPLVVNVVGACSKIKPNSIPVGSSCICPAGYEDVNNAYCQKCADGTYQPNQNQQSCIPCDASETTNGVLGSLNRTSCVCKAGLFRTSLQSTSCVACPYGLDCTLSPVNIYTVKPGYWRANPESQTIIACSGGSKQCPAGNSGSGNELCATGYKGPACSICKKGYGFLGGSCLKCPDKGLNSFLLLVLILVTCGMIYVLVKSTTRDEQQGDHLGVTVKVLIAYMQVLYYVGKASARWSSQSSRFFQALIPVTLSPSFLSIQCSTDFGFYNNIALMMCLPIIIIAGVALGHFLLYAYKNNQRRDSYFLFDCMDDNSKTTLVLLSLVHPTISQDVIRSFRCTYVEGTGTSFMTDDMRVDCSSASYRKYVVVASLYTVFYIAGFLSLVMSRLIAKKDFVQMAKDGMHYMDAKIYVFFIRGYKRDYYLWEFMIIFRKIAIVIINSLFSDSIQLVWINLVVCFSLAYTVSAQPYRSILVNRLDVAALFTLLFTITLGFHSRLMDAPNSKAIFVLLVISNTLMTLLIILSAFKSLKPKISKAFDEVIYYLDVNKFKRKEFSNTHSNIPMGVTMYSRNDPKNQKNNSKNSNSALPVMDEWSTAENKENEIEL